MSTLDSLHRSEPTPVTEAGRHAPPVVRIRRRTAWRLVDVGELYRFRDLFRFLVIREIKVRYAQTAIGVGWAILQPLFSMLVFTVVFGRLARVDSDGVPYAIFSFVAVVPWMYFANALQDGVSSLIANANMIRKVYFPRMMMPLSAVVARLVDFAVAFSLLAVLLAYYGVAPNAGALMIPALVVMMVTTAAGTALWLTAFAVQYRDVKHAMTFVIQILMYAAPVVYPASLVPEAYQTLYAINPMVGVIEGMRAGLLGTRDMPWQMLAIGATTSLMCAASGVLYFRARERLFADVA